MTCIIRFMFFRFTYLFAVETLSFCTPWPLSLHQRRFLDFFNLTIACDMFDFHHGHVYVCTLYYFSRTLGIVFIELLNYSAFLWIKIILIL